MRIRLRLATLIAFLVVATSHAELPTYTEWVRPDQRKALQHRGIDFHDQDGHAGSIADLLDKPVLVTFFYSRCQNGKKCSMAVSRLAVLQRQLAEAGLGDRVRLLAITYEPQFDTPERINRYASDRGLRLGQDALALQLDDRQQQNLVDELEAPVNYNAGWVNTHGVELNLLDAAGRIVRKYQTVLWDNEQVVNDVKRLLAEGR